MELMTTYSQKLKHPRWQKKRLEILERDYFSCQLCHDKETTLHIHHLIYKDGREPWEYDEEELITYCNHCHRVVEHYKKYPSLEFIRIFKKYPMAFCIMTDGLMVLRWLKSLPELQFDITLQDLDAQIYVHKFLKEEKNGEKIH